MNNECSNLVDLRLWELETLSYIKNDKCGFEVFTICFEWKINVITRYSSAIPYHVEPTEKLKRKRPSLHQVYISHTQVTLELQG